MSEIKDDVLEEFKLEPDSLVEEPAKKVDIIESRVVEEAFKQLDVLQTHVVEEAVKQLDVLQTHVVEEAVKQLDLLETRVVEEVSKVGWCVPLISWFRKHSRTRSLFRAKPVESESTVSK
jgi:predicted RNA-binding protein